MVTWSVGSLSSDKLNFGANHYFGMEIKSGNPLIGYYLTAATFQFAAIGTPPGTLRCQHYNSSYVLQGQTNTLAASDIPSQANYTLTFTSSGDPVAIGDYIVVQASDPDGSDYFRIYLNNPNGSSVADGLLEPSATFGGGVAYDRNYYASIEGSGAAPTSGVTIPPPVAMVRF